MIGVLRRKTLDRIHQDVEGTAGSHLKRTLGPVDLVSLGIGAIIGAGIFATVGTASAGDAFRLGAGPSLMLSFAITAVVCAFTALCYAEMASMVPISGSAYTYSYATLGELIAWIIGWDLILEYAVGNVAVAISWANYFRSLLESLGIHVPLWLATDYRTAAKIPGLYEAAPQMFGVPIVFNLLAFLIVAILTVVIVWGVKESARFNAVMVGIKIVTLLFFIGIAFWLVSPAEMVANWQPFQPNGWAGTFAGAAVVFFAFIGFDAVSTLAEETKNPARDLPIGLIGSLIICTIFYIVVSAVFTGILPYHVLQEKLATEQAEPLTLALQYRAPDVVWATGIVALGSVIAHTAVLLVFQLGQARIFFSISRDGLLPGVFSRVHPRFRTPYINSIIIGLLVGTTAAFTTIDEMVDLTNIGTLFAFILVCIGIPILRYREPGRHRPFRVPFGPWIFPALGVASCFFLMVYLPPASWWRFVGWLVVGLSIYSAYGYSRSALGKGEKRTALGGKLLAVGFLLIAAGLFTIPHDAGPASLIEAALTTGKASHGTSLAGLLLAGTGAAFCLAGGILQNMRKSV